MMGNGNCKFFPWYRNHGKKWYRKKSLGTGIGKIWYRKKVLEPVSENFGTVKCSGIGIVNIWYQKKYRYRYRLKFWVPSNSDLDVGKNSQIIPWFFWQFTLICMFVCFQGTSRSEGQKEKWVRGGSLFVDHSALDWSSCFGKRGHSHRVSLRKQDIPHFPKGGNIPGRFLKVPSYIAKLSLPTSKVWVALPFLRTEDKGLRIEDWGQRTEDWGRRIEDWGLRIEGFRIKN